MKPDPMLVTTDVVLFGVDDALKKSVLLIKRKNPPFQNAWALPGGFVDLHEDLKTAALRELAEETNIFLADAEQLKAYGNPDRDERGRVITIAFWAVIDINSVEPKAQDDATDISWFPVTDLPDLAFDHAEIMDDALLKM